MPSSVAKSRANEAACVCESGVDSHLVDKLSTRSSLAGASAPPTSCLLARTSNVKHERGFCEATQDRMLSNSVLAENMAGWAGERGEEDGGGYTGGLRSRLYVLIKGIERKQERGHAQ